MSAVACHFNIRNTNVSSKLVSDGPAVSVARDLEVRDVGVNPTRVAVQQRCNSHPPWRRGVEGRVVGWVAVPAIAGQHSS
jgi:hypothetical protein